MTESKYLLHLVLVLCTVLCVLSETHREALCQTSRNLGYVCETHVIQTEDGFLLQSERLPNYGGYPVFLQHGLLDSSNTWVMNYFPDQNLATILHDAGYDVWLGNSRGNVYSSNHVVLDQSESAFWDNVDMDLMAMYDVPANIEYVLKATNHTSLTWVGHSQGTWQGFSAFSTLHPTYATKVDLFVALGPVATAGHQKSLILDALLALHTDQFVGFFGDRAFLPQGNFIRILSKICLSRLEICTNGLAMLCGGANIHNVNSTQIYELTKYGPGGTSVHNMQHWAQLARSKKYQMFDYGQIKNMQHYEQSEPPQYTLHKYSGPKLALFYGQDDKLADLEDVSYIIQQIPQKYIVHQEEIASYGHMDFVWGMNAKDIVYNKILKLLNEHIPNDRIQRREAA